MLGVSDRRLVASGEPGDLFFLEFHFFPEGPDDEIREITVVGFPGE